MRAKGCFVASLKMRAYAQWMGLTLAERRAITEAAATRYRLARKRGKSRILDELCANTGWHRNHARKALAAALQPRIVAPRSPRPVKYGPDVIEALTVCWTVLGMPAGKRLAPMLGELVAVLRHFGELSLDAGTAELLVSMSAATIDRRLAGQRGKYQLRGRVGTKPGSLLKSQISVRTWAEWDDAVPGFVEIDAVSRRSRGGGRRGPCLSGRADWQRSASAVGEGVRAGVGTDDDGPADRVDPEIGRWMARCCRDAGVQCQRPLADHDEAVGTGAGD